MPTYRKIDVDHLGITPDEVVVTRQTIQDQKRGVQEAQMAFDAQATDQIAAYDAELAVLDA